MLPYRIGGVAGELLVDEMLAISEQIKGWRDKKEAEEAKWRYTLWLNSDERE